MSFLTSIAREIQLVKHDRVFLIWIIVTLALATFALWSGMAEVRTQNAVIETLITADELDRSKELAKQSSWGGAAYYSFHFTYSKPSDFAFAAIGERDSLPWKHRIRMLALEGQIYEHDAGNPELALIGRFDYAFLVSLILPLILIVLLYDLKAAEKAAGRFEMLSVTSKRGSIWLARASIKSITILMACVLPLLIAGWASGTNNATLLLAALWVALYGLFWSSLCLLFAHWDRPAPVILAALVGIWILLGTLIPMGSQIATEKWVPMPSGADILMTQREAVNDAWDLPVSATMAPFTQRHPYWSGYRHNGEGFDWPWYYAFQQVGDQVTEDVSQAYQKGRIKRAQIMNTMAILSPPLLIEQQLQRLAKTDIQTAINYENDVRRFHAELRHFFYPFLFGQLPYEPRELENLPTYQPPAP